jgi:hypothetical protein
MFSPGGSRAPAGDAGVDAEQVEGPAGAVADELSIEAGGRQNAGTGGMMIAVDLTDVSSNAVGYPRARQRGRFDLEAGQPAEPAGQVPAVVA